MDDFFRDGVVQIADVFHDEEFLLSEPDLEMRFDRYNQVDVRKGIPAVDIVRGHLGGNFDVLIVKHFTKYPVQSFLQFHD
jgi:hypothetical protein